MTEVQGRLSELMSDLSEEHYCAGWLIDLEFILWGMVLGGPREFGLGTVSVGDVEELSRLALDCGGWIVWDDGPRWASMDEWKRILDNKPNRPLT